MSRESGKTSDSLSYLGQGYIAPIGAALALVLFIFVFLQASALYEENLILNKKAEVNTQLFSSGNTLENQISHILSHLDGLDAFIRANPTQEAMDKHFQAFAFGLYSGSPAIRSIEVYPNFSQAYVYPLEGNEIVANRTMEDLINDERPQVRDDVLKAIETRDAVITGPYEMQRGGFGIVVRQPVYIKDSLWGIVSMVIDVPPLLQESGLVIGNDNIDMALRDDSGQLLFGSDEIFQMEHETYYIVLSDRIWELAAVPAGGWENSVGDTLLIFQKGGIIIVILLTLVVYLLLSYSVSLKKEVGIRTASLKESESRYRQLFDNNSDSLFLIDENGKILDANKVAEALYGYGRDQLLKMDTCDFSPISLRDTKYPLKEIMDNGAQFQWTHVRSDGSEFPVDINASTIVLEGQKYILASVRDITNSKKIEKALLESEKKYRLLTDTARDFIIVHDLQGRLLYANKVAVEFSGYSEKEFLSRNVTDFISPEEQAKMYERKGHRIGSDRTTYLYETKFVDKDGNEIPVEVSSVPMEDKDIEPSILIVARDITERKMTESALIKSQEMFATVFNTVPDSIMLTSFDGTIINVNESFLKNKGFSMDELLGSSICALTLWPDSDICNQYINQLTFNGIVRNFETDIHTKYGETHSVIISGDIISTDSDKYILTVFRNITELKNTANELIKSKFLLDEVGDIAKIGGWEFDVITGVGTWTPEVARIHGLKPDDPASRDIGLSFFVSESREKAQTAIKNAIEKAQPYDLELELISADGVNKWVRTLGRPVLKDGKVVKITGSMQDITERKLAADMLRESEVRVKKKLNAIMEPDGDLDELELVDIVDIKALQALMDTFYQLTNIGGMAILDLKGNVLVAIGWQDICTKFHRNHPETCKHCLESDLELTNGVEPGKYRFYKCKNNMWDMVTPIMMGGSHLGNLFIGQFFLDDEEIPYETFRQQAKNYGFDEKEYLEALDRVPRWSKETVDSLMTYYSLLTNLVSTLSYSNIKLARTLNERDELFSSLRESEERFRATFEQAAVGMCQADLDGFLIRVNQRLCDIIGYDIEELEDINFAEFTYPEDLDKELSLFHDILSGAINDYSMEKRYVRKDGSLIWVNVTVAIVTSSEGKPHYFIGMVEDIDRRKHAEEEILHYTKRLNMLHNIDTDIISSVSSEQIANEVLYHLRKLVPCSIASIRLIDPVTNEKIVFAVDSEHESRFTLGSRTPLNTLPNLDKLKAGQSVLIPDLNKYTTPDSELAKTFSEEDVHSGFVVPLVIEGELMGILSMASDKPDFFNNEYQEIVKEIANQLAIAIYHSRLNDQIRQHADELERRVDERTAQLQEANKELEAFTYSVSHDLRAPLRAIDGFSRIITEDYEELFDDEGKRLFNVIRTNTQKMDKLITDLLGLSRVGRNEMNCALISMNAMVDSVYNDLIANQDNNNIEFKVSDLPNSYADPSLIKQIWVNLLSNAIKYSSSREKGIIEVGAYIEDGMNVYYVKDNGVGFDPKYSHKLFGIFQRLHSEKEFPGTGVGLAIVQRIARRHGGDVWGEGEVDKGATFYFSLPIKEGEDLCGE